MKRLPRFVLAAAVICFAAPAWAGSFSADMVMTTGGKTLKGKIFVDGARVRSEVGGAVNIVLPQEKKMLLLMPRRRMYMEHPLNSVMAASSGWERMPGEIKREKLGVDTIDGRAAVKYRITYALKDKQETILQWMDKEYSLPLKVSAEDGSWMMEYKNLKTGPQAASLFQAPSGYEKFEIPSIRDLGAMKGRFPKGTR